MASGLSGLRAECVLCTVYTLRYTTSYTLSIYIVSCFVMCHALVKSGHKSSIILII